MGKQRDIKGNKSIVGGVTVGIGNQTHSVGGKYHTWGPFQFVFMLSIILIY